MNRQATQFVIALAATGTLGVLALTVTVGEVFFDYKGDLTTLVVGGVLATAGHASAYLFRLNGSDKGLPPPPIDAAPRNAPEG